ncbi:MAG: alpha/beta hydrolase [Sulfitobacter sp.]
MSNYPIDPQINHDYNARESVASFDDEFAKLIAISDQARAEVPAQQDIVYDPASGSSFDLYGAAPGRPVLLWIHGGYWRMGSKEGNAFAAPGLVANDVAVAVMNYSLAPAVTLADIIHQVRLVVVWLYQHGSNYGLDTTKIHVGGSSAGGHLTGAVIADGWRNSYGLPDDMIGAALAISGIYDLEPLLSTYVNGWMDMNMDTVKAHSPIRYIPAQTQTHLILSVGGLERPGFLHETKTFQAAWAARGHLVSNIEMPGYNHFDITGTLADADAKLVMATREAIRAFH